MSRFVLPRRTVLRGLLGAGVSLALPLAVFFAFQRYFVQGLLAGSVK